MLAMNEAMEKLLATIASLEIINEPLEKSLGMVLAEDIRSPIDSPPFDKSTMDGYAIRSNDLATGVASLRVIEVVTAGCIPQRIVGAGQATQIMTGAPIPEGADAVVKVEETQQQGDFVSIATEPVRAGVNLIQRGTSVRTGDCVLTAGLSLNGARIGALAELGCVFVPVRRRPRVAILTTGDELVPIDETPGPSQIRNSNAAMLAAQVQAAGGIVVPLGIARDNRNDLRSAIRRGLECDLLVLSGGVSAGTLDLVPSVLKEADVRVIFHKVALKPGKPIWFGVWNASVPSASVPMVADPHSSPHMDRNSHVNNTPNSTCYVFGLPGNPVSSLVCCELFVRTAIRRLMGVEPANPQPIFAKLEHDYLARSDRPTYHPAFLRWTTDGLAVKLVPWHGSSDLCGTVGANGMAFLSGEARQYRNGDSLETFAW